MKRINLTLDTKAIGKARPRFTSRGKFVRTYSPKQNTDYEKLIRDCFVCVYGQEFKDYDGGVEVWINAYYTPPKSLSEKKKKELIGTPYLKKPDDDNIEKIIFDALNGVAYADDCQIYINHTEKYYNEKDFVSIEIYYKDL